MQQQQHQHTDDSPRWNMAWLYYMELSRLISTKNDASRTFDVLMWYSELRTIWRFTSFKIDKNNNLKIKFDEIQNLVFPHVQLNSGVGKQVVNLSRTKAHDLLDELDQELMVRLDRCNMIFPNIELNTGFDNIRKRYNLGKSS